MYRTLFFLLAIFMSVRSQYAYSAKPAEEADADILKPAIADLKYEILEGGKEGESLIKIIPENFPKNKSISILIERLNGARDAVRNLEINDKNEIIHKDNRAEPYHLSLQDLVRGEPVIIGVVEADGSAKAVAKIVPYPIEALDAKGRHLTLELTNMDGMVFHFHGEGFIPKEKLIMRSSTGKKVVTTTLFATKAGTFAGNLRPEALGKKSGTSIFEVSNKNTSLKVNFAWGKAAFESVANSQ